MKLNKTTLKQIQEMFGQEVLDKIETSFDKYNNVSVPCQELLMYLRDQYCYPESDNTYKKIICGSFDAIYHYSNTECYICGHSNNHVELIDKELINNIITADSLDDVIKNQLDIISSTGVFQCSECNAHINM